VHNTFISVTACLQASMTSDATKPLGQSLRVHVRRAFHTAVCTALQALINQFPSS